MKKGLELLKSVKYNTGNSKKLEELLGQGLPKSMQYFYNSFELGEECFNNAKRSFDGVLLPITAVEYNDGKNSFRVSHFYAVEELIEIWQEDIQYNENYLQAHLLPLAYEEIEQGQFFISLSDDQFGAIYYANVEHHVSPIYLKENVFAFVSYFEETGIIDEDFKTGLVYRLWGDQFWKKSKE